MPARLLVGSVIVLFAVAALATAGPAEAAKTRDLLIPLFASKLMSEDPKLTRKDATDQARILLTRVCLKSYPWPESVGNPVVALGKVTPTEMKGIVDELHELAAQFVKPGGRPAVNNKSHLKKALEGLERGYDPQQLCLWGEWVYVIRLRGQAKPEDLLAAVKLLRDRGRPIAVKAVERSAAELEMEGNTYYSTETLAGMIALMEFDARGKTLTRNQPRELLTLAAGILDAREGIPGVLKACGGLVQNPTDGILQRVGNLNLAALDAKVLEGVARVTPEGKAFTVVLRGKKDHTLRVSETGKVEVK